LFNRRDRLTGWLKLAGMTQVRAQMTLTAAEHATAVAADPAADRDLAVQQAQVWFAQAEARFLQLREKGWEPGKPLPEASRCPRV